MRGLMWVLLLLCTFVISCSGDPENMPSLQRKVRTLPGNNPEDLHQLLVVIPYRLSDEVVSEINPETMARLMNDDWRRTPDGLERIGPVVNFEIRVNGVVTRTDKNGFFKLVSNQPDKKGQDIIEVPINNEFSLSAVSDIQQDYRIKSSYGSSKVWTIRAEGCCKETADEDIQTRQEPMDGRCMDYNGPNTNGANYLRSSTGLAWDNFEGSDCYIAVFDTYCWTEHFPIVGRDCWVNHGGKNCSILINRPSEFYLWKEWKIYSHDKRHYVVFQEDGNLVVYDRQPFLHPIWNSNTQNRGATHCIMQHDGNLVIYKNNSRNEPVWNSNTWGDQYRGAYFVMQNDGNFVIYKKINGQETALWSAWTGNLIGR